MSSDISAWLVVDNCFVTGVYQHYHAKTNKPIIKSSSDSVTKQLEDYLNHPAIMERVKYDDTLEPILPKIFQQLEDDQVKEMVKERKTERIKKMLRLDD